MYDYRIKVEDEAGNVAYSDIKTIPAFDDGIRGVIDEAKAHGSVCAILPGINSNGSNGLGSGLPSGSNNKPMAYPCTLLSWNYNTGFQNSLIGFKIYRINLNADDARSFKS